MISSGEMKTYDSAAQMEEGSAVYTTLLRVPSNSQLKVPVTLEENHVRHISKSSGSDKNYITNGKIGNGGNAKDEEKTEFLQRFATDQTRVSHNSNDKERKQSLSAKV